MFGEGVEPQPTGDGRMVYVRAGAFPMSNVVAEVVWNEKSGELTKASGVNLEVVPVQQEDYGMYDIWSVWSSNDLFVVRLDMAFPKPSTNEVERANAHGEWRQLCFENIQSGFEPPPPPKRR